MSGDFHAALPRPTEASLLTRKVTLPSGARKSGATLACWKQFRLSIMRHPPAHKTVDDGGYATARKARALEGLKAGNHHFCFRHTQ
jgi:hypothetical protein